MSAAAAQEPGKRNPEPIVSPVSFALAVRPRRVPGGDRYGLAGRARYRNRRAVAAWRRWISASESTRL